MKKIILYGSKYGTTKCYAEKLSAMTGIQAANYTEMDGLAEYDTILYFGGIYAGRIMGLAKTVKQMNPKQKLVIVTVGLADPKDQMNADNIKQSLAQRIAKETYDNAVIYHLRGGIDYKRLGFIDKMMMKLLYYKVKTMPAEKQNEETKTMISTYNKAVDFIDFKELNKIIETL